MNRLKWNTVEMTYTSYKCGNLGEYAAFTIQWDGMSSRRDTAKHKLRCKLNGIKEDLGNFESEGLAMEKAEGVLIMWMNNSGLTTKEG